MLRKINVEGMEAVLGSNRFPRHQTFVIKTLEFHQSLDVIIVIGIFDHVNTNCGLTVPIPYTYSVLTTLSVEYVS